MMGTIYLTSLNNQLMEIDMKKPYDKEIFSNLTQEQKNLIISEYIDCYSVNELINNKELFSSNYRRKAIVLVLEEANVYCGLINGNSKKMWDARTKKSEQTTLANHGVKNIGETKKYGWNITNYLEYQKISYLTTELKKFNKQVEKLTKKNTEKLEKPEYCEYTGIRFIDVIEEKVNPNDPRKRTVDHKTPIILAYLNNWSPEETAAISNLSFVLRYVNTIKSNTDLELFLPIARKLRKIFINEGCPSN